MQRTYKERVYKENLTRTMLTQTRRTNNEHGVLLVLHTTRSLLFSFSRAVLTSLCD